MADNNLPRSAAEARATGAKSYFTGKPCNRGHLATRSTTRQHCRRCDSHAALIERRRVVIRATARKRYAVNRLAYNAKKKLFREQNRDAILIKKRAKSRARRVEQPELVRAEELRYRQKHRDRDLGRNNAAKKRRKQGQRHATPGWADKKAIQFFYDEAARLTRETGIEHQVDHIIPIFSKRVCGLHVENNLQVLTAFANNRKRNKF